MRIIFPLKRVTGACTETLLVLLCILPFTSCEPSKKSACDGFSERTFAITREEYRPCADEIMEALDKVRTHLKAGLAGDKTALSQARDASRELEALLFKTGIKTDVWSVNRPRSKVDERWPDSTVREMNELIELAGSMYRQCLSRPNQLEFDRGEEAHEKVLGIYRSLR